MEKKTNKFGAVKTMGKAVGTLMWMGYGAFCIMVGAKIVWDSYPFKD